MWAIPTGASWLLKKKKYQVKSPSPEYRVPETGSDPPIGSGRDSGRDKTDPETMYKYLETFLKESTRALWGSYKTNPLRRVNTDFVKIYLHHKHMELKKNKKKKKKYNKRYFFKRSTRRKPYLDPNRHVKKYNPKIWFILLSLFFFEDQLKYLIYMFIRQDMRKC